MTVYSKLLDCSCYELGHTWEPSCMKSWVEIAKHGYMESFKIYLPLHLVAALLRRKKLHYYKKKLWQEVGQSTLFLGTNAFFFIICFCLWRKLIGYFTFSTAVFLPAFSAAFFAILIERSHRRNLLAVYMLNVATESAWRMLAARKLVRPIPNGEVLLFSVVMAIYMYLYKRPGGLHDSTKSIFRFLLDERISKKPQENKSRLYSWFTSLGGRHELCQHPFACLPSVVMAATKMFIAGYALRQGTLLLQRPSLYNLYHRDSLKLGTFLATFTTVAKVVMCGLRRLRNKDSSSHGLLSGFLAGWSMMFFKSSTLALYLASKLTEILYNKGIEARVLPHFKHANVFIYAFCTAFVFHATVFEPHNLRPAYWKFLLRLTNGRFAEMNRVLLDVYGTHATKLLPNYWPNYDPKYTTLVPPKLGQS